MKSEEKPALLSRLESRLNGGSIPAQHRRWGRQLLEHLRRPVCVLVAEPSCGGLPTVLRLLATCEKQSHQSDALGAATERMTFRGVELPLSKGTPDENPVFKEADIIVFCGTGFDADMQATWAGVPERLRDNGFLVLTNAGRGQCETTARGEFLGVYAAPVGQGGGDMNASEIGDLHKAIVRLAELGEEADIDRVRMFLSQFPDRSEAAPKGSKTRARTAPVRASVPVSGGRDLLRDAEKVLSASGLKLQGQADKGGLTPSDTLRYCIETVRALRACFEGSDPLPPQMKWLGKAVQEAERMLRQLLSRADEDASVTGVTLLLQLRKEISVLAHSRG